MSRLRSRGLCKLYLGRAVVKGRGRVRGGRRGGRCGRMLGLCGRSEWVGFHWLAIESDVFVDRFRKREGGIVSSVLNESQVSSSFLPCAVPFFASLLMTRHSGSASDMSFSWRTTTAKPGIRRRHHRRGDAGYRSCAFRLSRLSLSSLKVRSADRVPSRCAGSRYSKLKS